MATISTYTPSYIVEVRSAQFELDSESTGSLVGPAVKKGERVLEVILGNDALGASTTLTVGDGASANRFITSTDTSTAKVTRLNVIGGQNYEYTADDTIDVTLGGATGTGTIELTVLVIRTFD